MSATFAFYPPFSYLSGQSFSSMILSNKFTPEVDEGFRVRSLGYSSPTISVCTEPLIALRIIVLCSPEVIETILGAAIED